MPGALPLLQGAIQVVPVEGGDGEQLYRVTGLDDPDQGGTPLAVGEVVFGMIGDRFVVASSERGAREAASMEVERVDDARGAAIGWADLGSFPAEELHLLTGVETVPLGELVTELEASTEGLEGRARIDVPGGLR